MANAQTGMDQSKPAAVRIRDNQRRARARRKELVDEMRQKLQDYERRGVEATLDMQQAARKVAVENQRLRALLKRYGVADDEVETYLRSFPQGDAPVAGGAADAVPPPEPRQQSLQDIHDACCGGRTHCTMAAAGPASIVPSTSEASSGLSPPPIEPSGDDGTSPYEMSCTAAALIITQMQGQAENGQTRAALGCNGEEECVVKNTTLFQILEREQGI